MIVNVGSFANDQFANMFHLVDLQTSVRKPRILRITLTVLKAKMIKTFLFHSSVRTISIQRCSDSIIVYNQ